MRTVNFYADRLKGDLVQGLDAPNPLGELAYVQGDTLEVIVHSVIGNPSVPAIPTYVEEPLSFSAMRASIGYIDAAPRGGSFKLKVEDQVTAQLNWPADVSTKELRDAWKLQVLNALKALSNVDADAIRLDDPADTPAHIFYFTWLAEDDERAIEVIEKKLLPFIDSVVTPGFSSYGYTQQLKLIQYPLAMTTSFARPMPPAVTVIDTRTGATGINAEQTIIVPSGATGSVSFAWNGSQTRTIAVSALTAPGIAAALNEIVPDGATNPSFAVEVRPARGGYRFAVQFTGPLAGAPQDQLDPVMHDQQSVPWARGVLSLDRPGIEQALNGAGSVTLKFELVIVTGDGEETFIRTIVIANDMTAPSTPSDAETDGAIAVIEKPIYIDTSEADPFLEAAPGFTFVPTTTGSSLVITHGLGTTRPDVRVTLFTVNPALFAAAIATDAGDVDGAIDASFVSSRTLKDSEFSESATSENVVQIGLPWTLRNSASNPNATTGPSGVGPDFRLVKIDVASPMAILTTWSRKTLWSDCRESLPGGLTVAQKFALLEAAIGMLDGALTIDASQITGVLKVSQIDVSALATSLVNNANFATAFNSLLQSNSTLINAIAAALSNSATFVSTLTTIFANNPTLITQLGDLISTSTTFTSSIRETVYSILQGGGALPDGAVPMLVEDFEAFIPASQQIEGPSITRVVPVTEETTTTTSGGSSKLTQIKNSTESTPTTLRTFVPLSRAITAPTSGGTVTDWLPRTGTANAILTVGSGGAKIRSSGGRRGFVAAPGTKLVWGGRHYYPVVQIGDNYYPIECERELFSLIVSDAMLYAGSRFQATVPLTFRLSGDDRTGPPPRGRIETVIEIGALTAAGSGGDLASITWTPIIQQTILLSPTAAIHSFGVVIERASGGALSGLVKRYGKSSAFTPAAANFALRGRATKFDIANDADPRGSLSIIMKGATASIAALV
jgi:hypothetical protein